MRKSCCFNAPPALLRLSGGPTANLSRFPWSGGSTLNLMRFPSLGWSCGYSLVFSEVLVVLRSISRVIRCCPLVASGPAVVQACASCVAAFVWWSHGQSLAFSVVWWSYGKSLALSVVVRWLPVAPRWFKRFTGNAAGSASKMTPRLLQNVAPEGSKSLQNASWGPPGDPPRPSRQQKPFVSLFSPSWGALGGSWGRSWGSWTALGCSWVVKSVCRALSFAKMRRP